MKTVKLIVLFVVLSLFVPLVAAATSAIVDPAGDPGGWGTTLIQLAGSGSWLAAGAVAVMLLVWGAKKFFGEKIKGLWLVLMSILVSLAAWLANSLIAGTSPTWQTAVAALLMAAGASGLWSWLKELPSD